MHNLTCCLGRRVTLLPGGVCGALAVCRESGPRPGEGRHGEGADAYCGTHTLNDIPATEDAAGPLAGIAHLPLANPLPPAAISVG